MVKYTIIIVTSDNCQTIHKPAKMGFTSKKTVYASTIQAKVRCRL